MGILTMKEAGYIGAIYYALAYLVMNFTVFMVISEVAKDGRDLKIVELAGLYRRSPLLGLSLILGIFALAGVPPSIGFTGKLLLFTSAMNQGYFWLVLIGAVNGTISLYYYLRVIYAAYFRRPEPGAGDPDPAHPPAQLCPGGHHHRLRGLPGPHRGAGQGRGEDRALRLRVFGDTKNLSY